MIDKDRYLSGLQKDMYEILYEILHEILYEEILIHVWTISALYVQEAAVAAAKRRQGYLGGAIQLPKKFQTQKNPDPKKIQIQKEIQLPKKSRFRKKSIPKKIQLS